MTGILGGTIGTYRTNIASTTSFESIATYSLSSATSFVTFSSIPTTYKHLQIRTMLLNVSAQNNYAININGDFSTNYASHQNQSNGSTTVRNSSISGNTSSIYFGFANASSLYPFVSIIDILDYRSTIKTKSIRGLSGQDGNGTGTATDWRVQQSSGLWYGTAAITSVTLSVPSQTMGQYSSIALYGIKG
jgi:hypothetical protein